MKATEMPFGKHQGKKFYEIPSDYLKWAAENIDNEDIACAADDEWQHREHYGQHFYDD